MVLQKMRGGAGAGIMKFVLLGLLVMAVAGLVMMDVQGFFRDGMRVDTVAKGGGVRISTQDFDRTVRRILATQGISAEEAYRLGLIDQILQGEIQARLMTKEAHDLGLVISDDVVKAQIAELAAPLAQGGRSKSEALQQVLRSQGISENEFISGIRQEMSINLLRNALVSGSAAVSDDLATALYQSDKETRAIEAVVLSPASVKGIEEPGEDNLKTYYEANKLDYAIPETRRVTLAFLSEANLEDSLDITEDELKAAYEENIAAYQKAGRREVEQAVFTRQPDAEKVLAAVKGGKGLKQATFEVTNSNDPYLGKNAFEESGLLSEIADPVFAAKQGDVVGPLQSPLGWHVLIVGKDVAPETTPFSKVREALEKDVKQARLMDTLIDTANQIDDRLASGEDLDTLVKEYGLTTEKIGPFRQTGFSDAGKNLFEAYGTDSGRLIDAAFTEDTGMVAPILEMADGRFAMVRVDEITPIAYKPYEDVKTALKDKWLAEQRGLMNRARAQEALAAAEKGDDLETIAQKNGTSVQTFAKVSRTDAGSKAITPVALSKIFSVDKGGVLLAESETDIVLVKVTDISLSAGGKPSEAELKAIKERVARENAQETLLQYINDRSMNSAVRVNDALLARLYGGENG